MNDCTCFTEVMEAIRVPRVGPRRPRIRPVHVLGDKGYSSRATRTWLRCRGIAHTIPERADQVRNRARLGRRGGRPPAFDRETYKRRNVVERCFNRLKQWRGIATRYDKAAESFQAAVTLASLLMWVRCFTRTTGSWTVEFGLPSLERRLDLISRVATAADPLCDAVLRVPLVQHLAVCVDLQDIAVDREDLLHRRAELEESGSVVKTVEQVNVDGAVRQVEGEEQKRSTHVDRKMSHRHIMPGV